MGFELEDKVRDYLREQGYEAWSKRLDAFTNQEGIVVRPFEPQLVNAYLDGSKELSCSYRVVVIRYNEEEAALVCNQVMDVLDGATIDVKGWQGQEVKEFPHELGVNNGLTAWEVIFEASIFKEERF